MAAPKYFDHLYRQDSSYFNHIEGLRALAGFWMILYHLTTFASFFVPASEYRQMLEHPFFKMAISTSVSLDIFFVVSGLVIGYTLINELKNTGSVDLIRFFVKRCARVYPVYLCVIALCALFSFSTFNNAWSNILQVNNFIPVNQQYIPCAWSLAVDFQFYAIFSLIIFLISKNVLGKGSCYALICLAFLTPFISTAMIIKANLSPSFSWKVYHLTNPESWQFFDNGFAKLHVRLGPLLYGVLTSYILVHHRKKLREILMSLRKGIVNLLALGLILSIAFLLANDPIWFLNEKTPIWQTGTAWPLLLQRNIFSFLLCALILLSDSPRGIIITLFNKIFSSALWRPLGQLSFSTYMIHPLVITFGFTVYIAIYKTCTISEYINFGLCLIPLIYFLAIPIYLYLEQPAMNYFKQKLLRTKQRDAALTSGQTRDFSKIDSSLNSA
jgi:peptidoglycan/LPS O-acetylase OafA/YrhL